jgi:outer membrane protein insertion porin family
MIAPATRRRRRWRGFVLGLAAALAVPATVRAQGIDCANADDRDVRVLTFEGNRAFTSRDLALRIATSPSNFWRRTFRFGGTRHCLDSDALRLDVGRLRAFYRRHGYYAAAVDTAVVADGPGAVTVRFRIREGQPILIDTLRIRGLDSVTAPLAATGTLDIRQGRVFDITLLQAAIDSIKARLRNNGYPRADVAASYSPDSITRRAVVGLTVIPDARARIGAIHITEEPLPGQATRLGEATARRLIPVHPGDLYSARDLADAQRTLYQTALFRKVALRLAPDSLQPPGDTVVALEVLLAEDYMRAIDTEVGWAELDCFKDRTHYVDKNFLGSARRLDLTAQVSKVGYGAPTQLANGSLCAPKIRDDSTFSRKLNYYVGATVRFPTLFGIRTSPSIALYTERRSEYKAYSRLTKVGGEASLVREVAEDVPLRVGYSLEYGHTEAQPALICAIFRRCTSEEQTFLTQDRPLAVLSAHLERVRIDNPFDPRSGTSLRLDLRGATRELGSSRDLQFVKAFGDLTVYHGLSSAVTLALRARVGTVVGRSLSLAGNTGFIPPEERLYAGGATSVRGFQQNELGDVLYLLGDAPRVIPGQADTVYYEVRPDTAEVLATIPVGGTSLVVLNVELRVRSPFYPELLQFSAFADAGDVWQRSLHPDSHKASSLYLNALKWTPGIGLRIFSPVGPIQVNVGYNPFARPAGALYYIRDADPTTGFAPLYCVSPGNGIPAPLGTSGQHEQLADRPCPSSFTPAQSNTFVNHLKLSFSIGPDF